MQGNELRLHPRVAEELLGADRVRQLIRSGAAVVAYVRPERALADTLDGVTLNAVIEPHRVESAEAPPKRSRVTQLSRPCENNCGGIIERRPGSRDRLSRFCERCR